MALAKRLGSIFGLAVASAFPAVHSVHVLDRTDIADGKQFGPAGSYERIVGKAYCRVDPKLPANRIITDIDLAPRNEDGMVEFAADFFVVKPRQPKDGNGTVLYEVSNRGRKGMVGMFSDSGSSLDPREASDFGDGFLLHRGFTLVWLAWQFDVPDQPELMRLYTPRATNNGQQIVGLVRAEFIPDSRMTEHSLADRNHIAYPVLDPNDPEVQLTVRDRCDSARGTVPRASWKFSDDNTKVVMEAGFEPGRIYEVVYRAKDPALVGLGPTAIRDFISYLKYGNERAGINALGEQRSHIKRAIGFGTSQSGRFLRTFLYYGFNKDEQGRKVFDGVWSHVAGGGRGSFNHRFAQPSRDGHPHLNCAYPTDIYPFTEKPLADSETGLNLGLLDRAMEDKVVPKVFYTNSSYEYWGRSAGLIHSSLDGTQDVELGTDSRAYMFAGTQHGPGSFPPSKGNTANLANGNDYRWHMRALLSAMNDWLTNGKEPPPSQIPQVKRDQLVSAGAVQWPKIPGSRLPERPQRAWRADYGPEFRTKGVVTQEPPKLGKPFATLVAQVDRDGNETSGIRHPMVQVPLATYAGWNLRAARIGAPDEMFSMVGSTFFFPKTKAERAKSGDPRLSIEERYKSKEDYLQKYEAAARALAKEGYLLESDLPKVVARGGWFWDKLTAMK
jgi:hypothetical protein